MGLILSPFLSKEKFRGIFGENFFDKPELQEYFAEILGLAGHKPFECVGEIDEARLAAKMAAEKYPELAKFTDRFPLPDFDKDEFHDHAMPDNFAEIWDKINNKK